MKYIYPAIFEQDNNKVYLVSFPDLDGCYTDGKTLEDALENAKDLLNLKLWDMEEKREDIPVPSDPRKIKTAKTEFISLISADTLAYRKLYDKKSVKKTLSIPRWLDNLATENNVNFSNILQNALKKQLNV
jgi:antitoxin HicB